MPTFPTTFDLAGEGFRLRRLLAGDAAALARASQDEESLRWADPTGLTEAAAAAEIAEAEELWSTGKVARFAIVAADGDRLLGTINWASTGRSGQVSASDSWRRRAVKASPPLLSGF